MRSIFEICNDLINRHEVLKSDASSYNQDNHIFNLIEELKNYRNEAGYPMIQNKEVQST